MIPAFALRRVLEKKLVLDASLVEQSKRQFMLDIGVFAGVGLLVAVFNAVVLGFPFAGSGLSLALGFVTLGFFAGIDLALSRERRVIQQVVDLGVADAPPAIIYPLTKKFSLLATGIMLLATGVIVLVILRDIHWLNSQSLSEQVIKSLNVSVLVDVIFVMGLLLLLIVNLIFSYSRNLRMLFTSQTGVLNRISNGDMDVAAPVATKDELGVIAGHTNMMVEALKDRMRLMEGMKVAQEVQLRLLPQYAPELPWYDVAGKSLFSDETGGDYFDYFQAGEEGGFTGVAVGDATGHGVGAALLMATVRAQVRLRLSEENCLAGCLNQINRTLSRDVYGTGRFMTLLLLKIDEETGGLHWACAGHDPPIHFSAKSREFRGLGCSGIPLGIEDSWEYEAHSGDSLEEGDILILGTDGVWEAGDVDGTMYGKARMTDVVKQNAHLSAQEILDAILADLEAFTHIKDDERHEDDVTLLILKARGAAAK